MKIKRIKIADGCHYIVDCKVNGMPAKFLVDTGASITMLNTDSITIEACGEIGIRKPVEGIAGQSAHINTIKVQDFRCDSVYIRGRVFSMMSMANINKQYESFGHPRIDGILGADIMHQYRAMIDCELEEMVFKK